jgi:hypothetical protein
MKSFFTLLAAVFLTFCTLQPKTPSLDSIAEYYVRLVLEIGQYDGDFVDAYYGPQEWKPQAAKLDSLPAKNFIDRAADLILQCGKVDTSGFEQIEKLRLNLMQKQLLAVKTKAEMMAGKSFTFDEEAQLLYDARPPHFPFGHFDNLLMDLDSSLPGKGDLSKRFNAYAKNFIIPKDKLSIVFKTAIAEARKRTISHYNLPPEENFVLEFVTGKSWSGYNYYQGKYQSLIQINTDSPIFIERALDLAGHEGYPGHHVLNVLLEQNLVHGRGWKEFTVYPLFSPTSLIAEGSANYGIRVAFPGEEKIQYEKDVLFPLAGFDPEKAGQYYAIQDIKAKLDYTGNEVARKLLNGEIDSERAAKLLEKYLLMAPGRAQQRTRFIEQYRSYVINYNLGQDIVARFIEGQGGTADHSQKRWEIFKELISKPYTASSMVGQD